MRAPALSLVLLLAFAQPVVFAETPREDAARHYQLGAKAFSEQRYADAETEFQAAYALAPEPALLYNLGRVRAALGRHAEAAQTFDRFIATQPPGTERAKVEALSVEEHDLAAKTAPVVTPVAVVVEAPPPSPTHHRFPYPASSSLGIVALALGAASLGTGITSQHDYDHCKSGCDPSEAHHGNDLKIASIVTLSIGSVAAVAGAIAFAVEHRTYRRETQR